MRPTTVQTYRWTRQEFEQLASIGIFDPEDRLELLDGAIFKMTPQSAWHATTVLRAQKILFRIFEQGYEVRTQLPLAIDEHALPEPDLAVVEGTLDDYQEAHPTTAVLVIEVSDSSLTYDKERKLPRYAQNGIPEYWIVNLSDFCLEVYRHPAGEAYQAHTVYHVGELVALLAAPAARIAVADLLPKVA
ncbi:MAG: Uma2 family endonuclease [Caldilineaceae bacterium]